MIQDISKKDKKIKKWPTHLGWIGRVLLKSRSVIPRKMDAIPIGMVAPEILYIFEFLAEEYPLSFGTVLLKAADYCVAFRDLGHLCGILVNGKSLQPLGFFDLGFSPKFDDHWIKFLSSEYETKTTPADNISSRFAAA
jgi:hypothetical protein